MTEAKLAQLAGEKSFARGAGYFDAGAVADLVQTRDAIRAVVQGNEEYRVVLRPAGRALEWSCTCPLGEEGTFCKHAVAAGLAWLAREGEGGDDLGGLRAHLESESKESLIELLVEQAANDPELRARLEAAALRRGPPQDIKAMKDAVNQAFAVRGFAGHHHMRALIARADGVVHRLETRRGAEREGSAAVSRPTWPGRQGLVAAEVARSDHRVSRSAVATRSSRCFHVIFLPFPMAEPFTEPKPFSHVQPVALGLDERFRCQIGRGSSSRCTPTSAATTTRTARE